MRKYHFAYYVVSFILILEKNLDKINWSNLSGNINAIKLDDVIIFCKINNSFI